MLIEPYNFSDEHYKLYSHINTDIDSFEHKNINNYICNKLLGEGSYSTVYEVMKEPHVEKKYALKISKTDKDDKDVTNNEITILRKLGSNENIIKMYESFNYKDKIKKSKHLCIILDSLGCDLNMIRRLFKHSGNLNIYSETESSESDDESYNSSISNEIILKGVPINLSKKIGYQILNGLKHIHNKNIIHTDIKLEIKVGCVLRSNNSKLKSFISLLDI